MRSLLGGMVVHRHCYGAHKIPMLQERGFEPPWAFVYSDHETDLPLLRAGSRQFVVNPQTPVGRPPQGRSGSLRQRGQLALARRTALRRFPNRLDRQLHRGPISRTVLLDRGSKTAWTVATLLRPPPESPIMIAAPGRITRIRGDYMDDQTLNRRQILGGVAASAAGLLGAVSTNEAAAAPIFRIWAMRRQAPPITDVKGKVAYITGAPAASVWVSRVCSTRRA